MTVIGSKFSAGGRGSTASTRRCLIHTAVSTRRLARHITVSFLWVRHTTPAYNLLVRRTSASDL